jgi:hypothetical protein
MVGRERPLGIVKMEIIDRIDGPCYALAMRIDVNESDGKSILLSPGGWLTNNVVDSNGNKTAEKGPMLFRSRAKAHDFIIDRVRDHVAIIEFGDRAELSAALNGQKIRGCRTVIIDKDKSSGGASHVSIDELIESIGG